MSLAIILHDIGPAADWEVEQECPGGLEPGTLLFFAEVSRNGFKYTLYFDVTEDEAQPENRAELERWIKEEWNW